MTENELSKLSDQELLEKAKKLKSTAMLNATLVGFLIGIVIYGFAKNGFGFFALIPLFLAYKIINNPEQKALKKILTERGLN
jgi:hypothetical protein